MLKPTKRALIVLLFILSDLLSFGAEKPGQSDEKKPNVLFIMTDQLRRNSVGHMDGPVKTPAIDKLASEGYSFSQAYCNSPMCTPARAAFLTGKLNHSIKCSKGEPYYYNDRQLNTNENTIAKELNNIGYKCAYIGKWHNDSLKGKGYIPRGPRRMGFNDFWAGVNVGSNRTNAFYYTDDGKLIQSDGEWEPDLQTRLTIDYLKENKNSEQPFFLFLSWLPPHRTYDLPKYRQYLIDEARKQIDESDLHPNVPERLKDLAVEEYVQYHANVLGLDDDLNKILKSLKELGLEENTIVVFTSDHGENMISHGLKGKNQCYEEAAAIPFIIRYPEKIDTGKVPSDFINISDMAPTLIELCGGETPSSMQGKSFAPFLLGEEKSGPQNSAYIEIKHSWWDYRFDQGPQGHRRCIVTDDWKLVLIESKAGQGGAIPLQLYERKKDPFEMNNLASEPGCQLIINKLVQQMWQEWMLPYDDPFIHLTLSGLREEYGIEYYPKLKKEINVK